MDPSVLSLLSSHLSNTLNPQTRKQAEQSLAEFEVNSNFSPALLSLVQSEQVDKNVRFAGALYFKNFIKRCWKQEEGEPDKIPAQDRLVIKNMIVSLMIALPPALQVQVSEAVSIIADNDFPQKWESLLSDLISKLSLTDYSANIGVLRTAHSIFKRWRHQFRSNDLFREIKFVLQQFAAPYLDFFKAMDLAIDQNLNNPEVLKTLFQILLLLIKIFYSLNCQDLPEFVEDNMDQFMGLLHKYLTFSNPHLVSDDDEAGILEQVKSMICEVIDLYARRYEDDFKALPQFTQTIWTVLTTTGPQPKNDVLVSKSMAFLTSVIKPIHHKQLFQDVNTLRSICSDIVLPNMQLRESDVELFEDDPHEYIRRDLEGSDSETRRRAAADLVRGLLEHFAQEVTEIFSAHVGEYLQAYEADKVNNWKAKDTALYLITSLSAKSLTAQTGVTQTNEFINILDVFGAHILPELQSLVDATSGSHPIIKVDAIKYAMVFRSQLNREQILSVLPLLANHLSSANYVVYTWAAHSVERFLAMKVHGTGVKVLQSGDIATYAATMVNRLMELVEMGGTPEKMAENEYLMKAIMRIIYAAKQELVPAAETVLSRLNRIIEHISKNPSNPRFNHYLFESLSALIRFVCAANVALVGSFEGVLFGPFQAILQQDVSEFIPYVFQILGQLLALHTEAGIPAAYQSMLPPLLQPTLWESHGNIPALVNLLRSYLSKGSAFIVQNQHLVPFLGVSHKLLSSRLNDQYGFELIQAVFESIPTNDLAPYVKNIFVLLLTRLSGSKTAKYTKGFLNLMTFLFACGKPGFGVDEIIQVFEGVQNAPLFVTILTNILVPELNEVMSSSDRKQAAIGMTVLLTKSQIMVSHGYIDSWPGVLKALITMLEVPEAETADVAEEDPELAVLDLEEAGYQASFARLASTGVVQNSLLAQYGNADPRVFLAKGLEDVMKRVPGKVEGVIQQGLSSDVASKLTEFMRGAGVGAPLR